VDKIRKMEIQKLIKELEFLLCDINLKSETINEIYESFQKEIDNFIEKHPKLKFLVDDRKEYQFENNKNINVGDNSSQILQEIQSKEKDPKLKSLYRMIARSTHPDLAKQENLKEVYIDAKKAYEDDNLFSIISFCDKLNIPYNLTDDELDSLRNEVESQKKRLKFIETTFTWQWYKKKEKRDEIILSYIKYLTIK